MSSWSPRCNLSFVQTYSNVVLCIDGFKFKEGCICVNRNLLGTFLDYFPKIFKLTNLLQLSDIYCLIVGNFLHVFSLNKVSLCLTSICS